MSCLFFFQYRSTVWTTGCLDADFTLAKWTCLVVGSAGASSFLLKESNLLIPFIRQNKISAMIRKFTTADTKLDANPATSVIV